MSETPTPEHDDRSRSPLGTASGPSFGFSLPLLDDAPPPLHPAWARPHPVPTTLVALCPEDEPPSLDAVRAAAILGDDFIDQGPLEAAPGECFWSLVVGVRGSNRRILIWSEIARDLDPEELDDSDAQRCRYAVLLELVLQPGEAIDDLTRAMRLLISLVPDCPALLDLQARTWHLREGLERQFLADECDPPDWAMWTVTAVSRAGDEDPDESSDAHADESAPSDDAGRGARSVAGDEGPYWVATNGLGRCGLPELEMLAVPAAHVRTAVALLNDLAGLLLEEPPPPPGAPWEIGPEVAVTLRQWREVAEALRPDVPGSLASRRVSPDVEATAGADHPFAGVRAVVCDFASDAGGAGCSWPAAVARRIEAGGVVMYRAQRATAREARMAQRTFGALSKAFASLGVDATTVESSGVPAFFVKAAMALATDDSEAHEHLWLRLLGIEGRSLSGRLMHAPSALDTLHEGDVIELDAALVSSWQVICDGTLFVPDAVDGMLAAVDAQRRAMEMTKERLRR